MRELLRPTRTHRADLLSAVFRLAAENLKDLPLEEAERRLAELRAGQVQIVVDLIDCETQVTFRQRAAS